MKKLQSGYTTWEQGTRLLKLGVPKDSADFYWISRTSTEPVLILNDSVFSIWEAAHKRLDNKCAIKPCWSVGRLIEIMQVCRTSDIHGYIPFFHDTNNLIDHIISYLEEPYWYDFSKLDEE